MTLTSTEGNLPGIVDLFNALNSGAILTYNNNFVPNGTWLQPISILTGRMAKFSAEFTF